MSRPNERRFHEVIDVDGDDDDAEDAAAFQIAATAAVSVTLASNNTRFLPSSTTPTKSTTTRSTTAMTTSTNTSATVSGNDNNDNNSTTAAAAMMAVPLAFRLPDGRLMDSKNTLQSFVVQPTTAATRPSHRSVATAATTTTTVPKSAMPDAVPPPINSYRDPKPHRGMPVTHPRPTLYSSSDPSIQSRHREDPLLIRAQAVPVQSVVVAEGELVHDPGMYHHPSTNTSSVPFVAQAPPTTTQALSSSLPPPTDDALRAMESIQTAKSKIGTAVWLSIVLAIVLVGVVAGIGGYCGSGACSSSNATNRSPEMPDDAPSAPTDVARTEVPVIGPTMNPVSDPTLRFNEQLSVACQFVLIPNLTECQSTLDIDPLSTVGNSIPTEIGLLTQLTRLDLRTNQLTGTIPSELGLLTQLNELWFFNNQLSGTIPSTLGQLTRLTGLNFGNNRLSGVIPSTFSNIKYITFLHLFGNQLNGTIPSFIGTLEQLQFFYLHENQVTGTIPSIWCSTAGIDISIDCGEIVCDCCQSWNETARSYYSCPISTTESFNEQLSVACNFVSITNLTECQTRLEINPSVTLGSTIPTEIGLLTQLLHLDLRSNQLTGPIPSTLGLLTQLTELWLFSNQLTGTIPSTLGLLTKLNVLNIGRNSLKGIIPSTLGNMKQIGFFHLFENQLTGAIPSTLSNLVQLKYLYLHNNQLTGTVPSTLCSVSGIEIQIDCSDISCMCCEDTLGAICPTTAFSPGNSTNTTFNEQLTVACNFISVTDLSDCQLETSIVTSVGRTIPTEIGLLTQISYIRFDQNQLTGTIPPTLGNLSQLTTLALQGNQLTGTIPSTLGTLAKLSYLRLSMNRLTGTIPMELGNLVNLIDLDLYGNQLIGTIPSAVCSISGINLYIDCGEIACVCCQGWNETAEDGFSCPGA